MKHTSVQFISSLILIFIESLLAQGYDPKFEQFSVREGLSQSVVQCILQDSRGFMWFGTQDGLNKYDGYSFTQYYHKPQYPQSLSDDWIKCIAEDQQGDLWIVTKKGLNQYDRDKDIFIHHPNPGGIDIDFDYHGIDFIHIDKYDHIWIIPGNGRLYRFHHQTNEIYQYRYNPENPSGLSNDQVTFALLWRKPFVAFHETSDGTIWIGTPNGLNRYNREDDSFTQFHHIPDDPNSLCHDFICSVFSDSENKLWIGTADGLNRLNSENETFDRYLPNTASVNELRDNRIFQIFEDHQRNLWLTTGMGLVRFDRQFNQFLRYSEVTQTPEPLRHNLVFPVYEDKNGHLWLTCNGLQLYRLDPENGNFTRYTENNTEGKFKNVTILAACSDRSGILWLGTEAGGINKINSTVRKFSHYKSEPDNINSLSNNLVRAFCQDHSGLVWVGTGYNGGLNRLDRQKGRFTKFFHDDNNTNTPSEDNIWSIVKDRWGYLWIGTAIGTLDRFHTETEHFTHIQNLFLDQRNQSYIWTMHIDNKDNLWIGTQREGLKKCDLHSLDNKRAENPSFQHYTHDPNDSSSLSQNWVTAIYSDRNNIVWVGTCGGGLNRFDPDMEKFKHYQYDPERKESISNNYIRSICEDHSGVLWIGTDEGLNKFNRENETFTHYNQEQGLPSQQIYGILEDDHGNLWISTNKGISKFNPRTVRFRMYDEKDGIQDNEFNGGAYYKNDRGEMFFGGINGFNIFHPDSVHDNPHVPQIVITDFQLFNQSVRVGESSTLKQHINETRTITLSYRDDVFSFEFAALDYFIPEKNQYAYIMEGLEKNWNIVGNRRFATYTSLDPGDYVFKVKGSNNDGVWNEEGISIQLKILPPFWQTWWFRGITAFIIILTAVSLYKKRINRIEERKRELEIQVKEKTKAAKALENALSEVERLKNRLQAENVYLQSEIKLEHNFANIISRSASFKKVLTDVEQVAATDTTVMIQGESGTGKELIARAVHSISNRSDRTLVKVNCAAMPANLIESELFGHEKGAFTGAISRKEGRFELADGGTIFLDEIGDLPFDLQAKLLRVLQDGEYERLGSNKTLKVDVRVIAATNRDLQLEVESGRFREDLFYRLNVFPINVLPLRERKEDIPLLVKHFADKYSAKIGKKIDSIPQGVVDRLVEYDWPGNVRELENIIERSVIISPSEKLVLGDWFQKTNGTPNHHLPFDSLDTIERQHIIIVLEQTGWRVSGEKGAAKVLGLKPTTLEARMKKLNIHRNRSRPE